MKIFVWLCLLLLFISRSPGAEDSTGSPELRFKSSPGTYWWFGVINHGHLMPLDSVYQADLAGNLYGNQGQPLLLSSDGDVVWCDHPPELYFNDGELTLRIPQGNIQHHRTGNSLRDAFQFASQSYFPPSGNMPDPLLFQQPQYNTWIELMYDQNQQDILKYSRAIRDNGFPPGVIMIDDNWQEDYGKWDFHPGRFPHPEIMMDSLHGMGFKVMVWVCPFISPDSDVFRKLNSEGFLVKDRQNRSAVIRWWNGASALLDFSHPGAVQWFNQQLDYLADTYRVDGFKLDGGDPEYYLDIISHQNILPNDHTRLFGQFGLIYPLNEYRAMWKMGGQPLAERLRDKEHNWEDLRKLIPHILLQGLCGYPFSCPDMIGGGEYSSFLQLETVDQELIVRSTQVHALMPMMQFSVAPWRVLDRENLEAVKKAIHLRQNFTDYIMELAGEAALTNQPIVRSLEYVYPHRGYAVIKDQFLLGDRILVAPVLQKNSRSRMVTFPPGKWRDSTGRVYQGPDRRKIQAALDQLPYFERVD